MSWDALPPECITTFEDIEAVQGENAERDRHNRALACQEQ